MSVEEREEDTVRYEVANNIAWVYYNRPTKRNAQTRVLVPKSRKAEIVDAYTNAVSKVKIGNPFEADTGMGPLAMQRQLERVQGYIEKGKAEGATLALGGGRPADLNRGFFIEPTVFTDVDPSMTIFKEEIFGPVVSFIDYEDEADMIAKANDTTYGLHGAVYTNDQERGFAIARDYRAGSVTINGMQVDIHMPFGGFKQSGLGREGGIEGLETSIAEQQNHAVGRETRGEWAR